MKRFVVVFYKNKLSGIITFKFTVYVKRRRLQVETCRLVLWSQFYISIEKVENDCLVNGMPRTNSLNLDVKHIIVKNFINVLCFI